SVGASNDLELHRRGKFWRATEAAVRRIVAPADTGVCRIQQLSFDRRVRAAAFAQTLQLLKQRRPGLADFLRPLRISFSDADQDAGKARHVVTILRWKVGAAVKRHAFGR